MTDCISSRLDRTADHNEPHLTIIFHDKKYFCRLFKLQKKVFLSNLVVAYFISHTWYFKNSRTLQLEKELSPEEAGIFGFEKSLISSSEQYQGYIKKCIVGIEKDIFKRNYDPKKNRKHLWR